MKAQRKSWEEEKKEDIFQKRQRNPFFQFPLHIVINFETVVAFNENHCIQYVKPSVPGKDAPLATSETWPHQTEYLASKCMDY